MVSNANTWQPFYNLYNTDRISNDFDHDCLYSTITQNIGLDENTYIIQEIIEYCIRTSLKDIIDVNEKSISSKLTFDELKKNNITSTNIMEWSSPIDLIERYEYFLQMNTPSSSSVEVFYNCTPPWFGSFCQYRFIFNQSLSSFIQMRIKERFLFDKNTTLSCYVHMKCDLGSPLICLDWREICDGKVNCLDGGEDEKYCAELEINRCAENEYQCRNGMCVNEEFLSDEGILLMHISSPECLDGSDEVRFDSRFTCARDSSFKCEDVLCPQYTDFSCGDGNCRAVDKNRGILPCINNRDRAINYMFDWDNPVDARYSRCFKTLMCVSYPWLSKNFDKYCKGLCTNTQECKIQTVRDCPPAFIAPTFPVWDGHVRFGYFSNGTSMKSLGYEPDFVCYNKDRCPFLIPTFTLNNHTCLLTSQLNLTPSYTVYEVFRACNQLFQNNSANTCQDTTTTVRCLGTNKCIHKRRIMDGFIDCYNAFDESIAANSCTLNDKHRFQCTSEQKCLSPTLVNDEKAQCIGREDESLIDGIATTIHQLPYSAFCNNWTEIVSVTNESDETHCEQWPCVNQYTRCNSVWNCEKGIDEINCSTSFQCPANHHPCLSPKSRKMDCLHINRIEDGIIDCLGSTDERSHCRNQSENALIRYRCWNDTKCTAAPRACQDCDKSNEFDQSCDWFNEKTQEIIKYINSIDDTGHSRQQPFSHKSSRSFPPVQLLLPVHKQIQNNIIKTEKLATSIHNNDPRLWLCNKGSVILVGKNEIEQCLCPESYYGNLCQYQNQRVSLTIRLRQENLNKLNVIGIIIRLVDHTGFVHSYEQITYKSLINCNTKYNMHLLYQNRPKDMTKNYTIYIDAYDKVNLIYLTSWIFPVKFLFMPVNRMSVQLIIPTKQNCHLLCSDKYLKSLANDNIQSCRCLNWVNSIPTLQNKCNCSLDSICIGLKENRSICLCRLNKTGPRCYLNSICQMNNKCMNKGICVPYDLRQSLTNFTCVCPDGFSGEFCEKTDVRIDISFSNVEIPQSLLVHFINVIPHLYGRDKTEPIRVTMFKKILFNQKTIILHMSLPFHLVFVEFQNMYYLIILQHSYTSSVTFSTQISPSQRCPHIQEVLDEVIIGYSHLRRVKYYHTICQNHPDLICFHDSYTFMCLCTEERHANCFHFDFNMTYNCLGQNDCQNDGRCFQDHRHCPTKIIDETHCEQWPCVNQYTRCNSVWNCEKGIDEINCSTSFQCPANHHPCLSPKSRKMDCLHINRIEDGTIDCLGSTDERSHCRNQSENALIRYRCWNDTKCTTAPRACQDCDKSNEFNQSCDWFNEKIQDIIKYINSIDDTGHSKQQPFSHKSSRSFPSVQLLLPIHKQIQNNMIKTEKLATSIHNNDPRLWLCNKGSVILVGKNEIEQCLCPASYYGNLCQYQNQRVSLTIRLRQENLNKLNVIGIIIRFVDHTGFVHSYDQITYKSLINCNTKYNMHLLYQNRPKDMTKNYTIYIDASYKLDISS
ncbi:unnamed protein product [Adineta steineri]|uniref:EGF-like domain-containing protein n=1 Tax=Adineta steineri TaxID=433720 RepID=A0A814CAN9_9BILA|nr:unnamed protein product [Adineta steineri]